MSWLLSVRTLGRKPISSVLGLRAYFSSSLELIIDHFSDFKIVEPPVDFVEELYDTS
jgi:hypothetical protein